ncbi:phosphatase PAP2 family protein [Flavobacterium rhizosphaerae]|uniref:Phosphatase PAP2 family protein n=1 Tax=Flavobacterium rhizosphaerae TaxID=3163298 RepID=A0ABW8Z0V4_9FLAO
MHNTSKRKICTYLFCFIFLLNILFTQTLQSQTTPTVFPTDSLAENSPEDGSLGHKLVYDLKSVAGGVGHMFTGPLRWEKEEFIKAGAFVGASGLLLLADEGASNYFSSQGRGIPEGWHRLGWYMGKPQYNYTFTAGVYLTGLVTKNEKIRRTGVLIIAAATAGGLVQTVTKTLAGRARPAADKGNLYFSPFNNEAKYHSFPSGHTILSTTVVYAISKQFTNPWVKAGILSVGVITPASRLWDNAHWLSDVAIGAGIAVLSVESVDRFLKKKEKYAADRITDPHQKKISWNLKLGYNQIGIVGVF